MDKVRKTTFREKGHVVGKDDICHVLPISVIISVSSEVHAWLLKLPTEYIYFEHS